MIVPNNVYEIVSRSEIEDQETHLRDALIGMNNIYTRLRQQNAPQALLEAVFDIRHQVEDCLKGVREVRDCFPPPANPVR